jgi:hypothetical protein
MDLAVVTERILTWLIDWSRHLLPPGVMLGVMKCKIW